MSTSKDNPELLAHTAAIVASHVSNNTVAVADLPHLIQEVYVTLTRLGEVGAGSAAPVPAVPVSGSVTPDHIVFGCMIDALAINDGLQEALAFLKNHRGKMKANAVMFSCLVKGCAKTVRARGRSTR